MPETIALNINIVELLASKDELISISLMVPETIRFNTSPQDYAEELSQTINKRFTSNGEYLELLKLFPEITISEKSLLVPLIKDHEGILYPDLLLKFNTLFYSIAENKYLGFIPVLGIESFGTNEAELEKNLIENIKLEFARNKRLVSVNSILSTIWFKKFKTVSIPK
jgi:hypothetical protein